MKWYTDNVSPQVREFIEGALAFILPVALENISNALGSGIKIDAKTLLALCVGSLVTYIRTRPTKQ